MQRGDSIREVWASNLKEEMANIAQLIEKYNYVAMDTEFPGVVARPVGTFRTKSEYNYQMLRWNVDLLKIIQLGLAFSDADGNMPKGCSCWQFNFEFDLQKDVYAQDSIDLLMNSGVQFPEHEKNGIVVSDFGALLMESGLVLNEDVKWISFHSSYDFGYLLKILTCTELPTEQQEFFELLHMYFPQLLDMKYLEQVSDGHHGGLNRLAEIYQVERYGQMHQAGSDSLLTLQVFLKMREVTFKGHVDRKHYGILYGLGAAADTLNNGDRRLDNQSNHVTDNSLTVE
mmetsp:Transcript_4207/g.12649  ORF Transcript_4207/g.12649 Transcript_4207/m.12649 type:complete len:286 (+) Transcript_4207:355-1212(+)|eukprot:CAMPEP_0198737616 /NCGR_PEP_ID=MMETSP1475-20131203/67958_1 /TAXON_ID= ORGANISM="Unidentified sp., Strain CCMP1999" /NCGR_SAMPLE_ID=MMETSP1475 /ASSEMBLY_ACC=CAM_ASM_001111 /LENGTH=285 /DNA_ID=CAMNT_0044501485 /DNA_START=351 /DNA_END=1208 /DNA_ORIENTATION=-